MGASASKLTFHYQVELDSYPSDEGSQKRRTVEIMDGFPALMEVKITLQDVLAEEWMTFLKEARVRLQRVKKFMLEIVVSTEAGTVLCTQWPQPQITDEEKCSRAYQGPFVKQQDIWKDRAVSWRFEQETDHYARCHCVLGKLTVLVE